MKKSYKNIFVFLFGALFTYLLVFFFQKNTEKEAEAINKDYYILSNQIEKMNKMIVLEQNFSSFQTHKSSAFELGGIEFLSKEPLFGDSMILPTSLPYLFWTIIVGTLLML